MILLRVSRVFAFDAADLGLISLILYGSLSVPEVI